MDIFNTRPDFPYQTKILKYFVTDLFNALMPGKSCRFKSKNKKNGGKSKIQGAYFI
jgi:hypothetical protein